MSFITTTCGGFAAKCSSEPKVIDHSFSVTLVCGKYVDRSRLRWRDGAVSVYPRRPSWLSPSFRGVLLSDPRLPSRGLVWVAVLCVPSPAWEFFSDDPCPSNPRPSLRCPWDLGGLRGGLVRFRLVPRGVHGIRELGCEAVAVCLKGLEFPALRAREAPGLTREFGGTARRFGWRAEGPYPRALRA